MRDLRQVPGSVLYLPWACPRCSISGTIGTSPDAPLPFTIRAPCCGMPLVIFPTEEMRKRMSVKLNAAIKLLDPDARYRIRYGTDPIGEYEAVGYVDTDASGTLFIYATEVSNKPAVVLRTFVKSITTARKPYTQVYPATEPEKEETNGKETT